MSYPFHRVTIDTAFARALSFPALVSDLLANAIRAGFPGQDEPNPDLPLQAGRRRPTRTADLCKQYLRLKHGDRLPRVEEFIMKTEPPGQGREASKWELFIDLNDIMDDVLKPLDAEFDHWLNS